ncbi:hypothetical protein HPC49_33050 [Pyxidicoccus fallax]|uniref:Peptidase C-terminal archaeal/bacterial domain-containing protein n=1 Tax=Pyxidicoccus fallax TaxID=394095 RepID=A0A848LHL8_9BACT|nr:hypothetical protein [Pyxidicoccus fallax]NMO16851.1 hypothetical protein [Pyxidicoccus fallax]NPC83037.1 hypothetical protein [Pyxidicoccus fallax]
MRSQFLKACLVSMLALATACGGVPDGDTSPESPVGESTRAVLYPPPAPASGNILDSTTYMGRVNVPGAIQTQFTTTPQYFSFSFHVTGASTVKLEVTHLGSSMYLDTGLFLYGPRRADGSFGNTLLAVDDDSGYGQLSRISSVSLPAQGEYLAVVTSGSGAGKNFRLQVDCLGGACVTPQPAPSGYTLQLAQQPLPPHLEQTMTNVYWGCEGACNGWLRAYSFPWPYTGNPTLAMATRAVQAMPFFSQRGYYATGTFPFANLEPQLLPIFSTYNVPQQVLSTYGNGVESVVVASYASPLQGSDFNLFVILFPESRKVVTIEQEHFW